MMVASAQVKIEPPEGTPKRPKSRQTRYKGLRGISPAWRANGSLPSRAADCLWPWSHWDYPGLLKGLQRTLGVFLTRQAFYAWADGRNRLPVWVAERMRDELRQRAERGLSIADELDAYIATRNAEIRHQKGLRRARSPDE